MMGIATLMPFNSIMGPIDFYLNFYQSVFIQALSFTITFAELIGTLLMIGYGYRWNPKIMLTFPLYVWVVCLIIIPLFHLAFDE